MSEIQHLELVRLNARKRCTKASSAEEQVRSRIMHEHAQKQLEVIYVITFNNFFLKLINPRISLYITVFHSCV